MADTQRSVANVLSLLADNTTGSISPQDLRDGFVSWQPGHGQLYVTAANSGTVTISSTSGYFECTTPTWTLSTGAYLFDESGGNGRLTYTGSVPVTALITCAVSMTAAGSNDVTHWRLGLNGATDEASEIQRKIGTGSDVGALALGLEQTMTNGDYLSLWCRNSTATDNLTVETASIQVVTFPQ